MRNPFRTAAWWAADYVYAGFWQLRAFWSRTDPAGFETGPKAPIVILPGVYETWRFMQPLISRLHADGHGVHVLDKLERNQRPVAEMAHVVDTYLREADLHDVVLVAHSKGGLAGKLTMLGEAGERIRGMLAVATPFGGSRYARLLPVRTLRAFSPEDPGIVELARHLDINARIVSVYAEFDPHIPEGSELPGAKNVRLDTGGHFRILADPRVIAELAVLAE
ncbi:esterase/lipase family protein [Microbacterium sp. 179-I 3D4 NHS]|uniref:esterase/lipase family protein n=1 Tax=Microbacterium sp. 179-I 3D4 NHS TaxID=3142381 RepID=UPI0039A2C90F